MSLKNVIKKILLVSKNEPLTTLNILKRWNIRFGKYIWKKKYTTNELIDLLKKTGLKKGDTVFIQAAWDSFYNYLGIDRRYFRSYRRYWNLNDACLSSFEKK